MSIAQQNLISTINHLGLAFNNPTLIDAPPPNLDHNNVAKILRNGMAVVGFVTLEDYIKNRTSEILELVSNSGRGFTDLPMKLQFSTTNNLIKSFPHLLKLQQTKTDKISFILNHATKLASTSNTPFDFSEYTFGYSKSNISKEDIIEILKSFYINDCWNQMSQISARLGLTGHSLEISFNNATNRRHSAAHDINANTPINDLTQFITEAIGFAISYDALLMQAYKKILNNNTDYLNGNIVITSHDVKLSTIKLIGGKWKYKKEVNSIATRSNPVKNQVVNYAINSANINGETIVFYDTNNKVEKWIAN